MRFYEIMFDFVMCQDTFEPICFKLRMMLNMTKLYSLMPEWLTLMFTQGHRVTGNVERVLSFCCKVAWSNPNVCDGWLCKSYDCEEVLQVWRIWIVWAFAPLIPLLFLLHWMITNIRAQTWESCSSSFLSPHHSRTGLIRTEKKTDLSWHVLVMAVATSKYPVNTHPR